MSTVNENKLISFGNLATYDNEIKTYIHQNAGEGGGSSVGFKSHLGPTLDWSTFNAGATSNAYYFKVCAYDTTCECFASDLTFRIGVYTGTVTEFTRITINAQYPYKKSSSANKTMRMMVVPSRMFFENGAASQATIKTFRLFEKNVDGNREIWLFVETPDANHKVSEVYLNGAVSGTQFTNIGLEQRTWGDWDTVMKPASPLDFVGLDMTNFFNKTFIGNIDSHATAEGASVFGGVDGKCRASGKNSIAGGKASEASTEGAIALGYACKVTGNRSVALGQECTIETNNAVAAGYGCKVLNNVGDATGGNAESGVALGSNNTVTKAKYGFAAGRGNTTSGNAGATFGQSNINGGNQAIVAGSTNTNTATNSAVIGGENKNAGAQSLVIGYRCTNGGAPYDRTNDTTEYASYAYVDMSGNRLVAGRQFQTVRGQWNAVDDKALAVWGNGDKTTPKNVFTIGESGTRSDTKTDGVTVAYLESALAGYTPSAQDKFTAGASCNNTGTNAIVVGKSITNSGAQSAVFGHTNTNSGSYVTMNGYNNNNTFNYVDMSGTCLAAASQLQTIRGRYNVADKDALAIFGWGDDTTRKNAFTIGKTGTRSTVDTDGVTVKYLKDNLKTMVEEILLNGSW
jgi:hypothetical protein